MQETIEDIQRGRSWMPLAMTAAFVVGASVAGWFAFREDIAAWFRIEDLTWEPAAGERLVLVQRDRVRAVVSGEPDRIAHSDTQWAVVPTTTARIPGNPVTWTQTLQVGTWEVRDGDVVIAGSSLAPVDPAAPPSEPSPRDPRVSRSDALLDWLAGIDAGVNLGPAGAVATSAAAPEALEQIETRRTQEPLDRRKPLDPVATDALYADLEVHAQRAAFDVTACLPGDLYRPGQTWTREATLSIGAWGPSTLRIEIEHDGYEGDVAILTGTVARKPNEGALTSEDGLSGLKGTIQCRFDVLGKRLIAGRYSLEARGKSDRKFVTLGIDHAFALAGATQTAEIPANFDLTALPPAAPPPEPPGP